jgi:transmembrane sensor
MNNNSYSIEELLDNNEFIAWAKNSTPENSKFWNEYLLNHPKESENINKARFVILAVTEAEEYILSKEDEVATLQKINRSIFARPVQLSKNIKWAAAASVVIGISVLWYVFSNQKNSSIPETYTYNSQITNSEKQLNEVENLTSKPIKQILPDGSIIILEKNSKISYVKGFQGNIREVYLSGEAFFEVTKNPSKPFVINSNGLITKVLGTSFTIKAYENEKEFKVMVKSGKVSVYKQIETAKEAIILNPNQQVVFDTKTAFFIKSIVENPIVLDKKLENISLEFDGTPVGEVFKQLEKIYGIEIVYDNEIMTECFVTASLSDDDSLYNKLQLVCKAIESTYEISDGKIIIVSKGCK